ncbi:hypothetical protein TNCV_412671 [Trichonephila clavipes]|uniref:Uncharacterized protein n=1 Tax=Trichonephila clavipes TaxID=2585209 RepID=A0A8X6V6C8_TRICX|nr:hypothetical protein TNCV_412671 [Trichonephila clavipes]
MATLLIPSVPGMSFRILFAMGQERGVCCHQISELDCPLVPQIGKLSTWAWIGSDVELPCANDPKKSVDVASKDFHLQERLKEVLVIDLLPQEFRHIELFQVVVGSYEVSAIVRMDFRRMTTSSNESTQCKKNSKKRKEEITCTFLEMRPSRMEFELPSLRLKPSAYPLRLQDQMQKAPHTIAEELILPAAITRDCRNYVWETTLPKELQCAVHIARCKSSSHYCR